MTKRISLPAQPFFFGVNMATKTKKVKSKKVKSKKHERPEWMRKAAKALARKMKKRIS